jgi:predicted Zn-dependent protease
MKINNPEQALYAFKKAQDLKNPIPNLPLRMAHCYKLLNRISEMEQLLEQVLKEPSMPEQFKMVARNELAQVKTPNISVAT